MEEYSNRDGLGTRILVIGCPGSGKSTFARKLQRITGLPLYHLDLLYWKQDRTIVPKDVFLERLEEVLRQPTWIIDGNYGSTLEQRLQRAETVFFLDYDIQICFNSVLERRGKERPDMPWIEQEGEEPDWEFLDLIRSFSQKGRKQILELMERYPEKDWIVFQNRAEGEGYFEKAEW